MRRAGFLLACLLLTACGDGGASDSDTIQWTYRISPANQGRSRAFTTPAIAPDGTIYVGGAVDDASNTACLYAFGSDGELKKTLTGSVGDFRGAPTVWPVVPPHGDVAYAVDEEGGLYAMRVNGRDTFRTTPEEAFAHMREKNKPRLLGPIIAGTRGEIFSGGTGKMHVLFIESRSTPLSLSVACGDEVHPSAHPNGQIYCKQASGRNFDELGKQIGTTTPTRAGIPQRFDSRGRSWWKRGREILSGGFRYSVDEFLTSGPLIGHGDTIYFTTARKLVALNRDKSEKWVFDSDQGLQAAPLLTDDRLYITDTAGRLLAFSPEGEELWRAQLGEYCVTPAIGPDGTLYTTCLDGLLYAVTPPSSG